MRKHWYLILPIVVFSISCCDLAATLYFERTCDHFQEANPIALHFWETYGDGGLILFKLYVTFVSCICMGLVLSTKSRAWRLAVSLFGLISSFGLVGWWIFWFFFVEQGPELNV